MANQNWKSNLSIKDELFKYSHNFSFIQVYRLLSLLLKEESNNLVNLKNPIEYIHIRPELSLNFPTSDVVSIEEIASSDKLMYQITASFLGLYGSSSPLPTFYTESLFREQAEDNSLNRKFIDILNNHLYQIFFEIWSRYKLSYQIFEKGNSKYLSYLYGLGGVADSNIINNIPDKYNPIRYLSILGNLPKTAYWLKILLIDLLEIDSIEIQEFIDTALVIPKEQRLALGVNNHILGESTHLGEQIISSNHVFSIQIGPISYQEYKAIMPKTAKFRLINQILKMYLETPLIWNVKFKISSSNDMGVQLGLENNACLGYNSWLFNNENQKLLEYIICFENPLDLSA